MEHKFDYGEEVRVTRNVRNDGTYPGMEIGEPLVRRGSSGFVMSVGTFLQDQIIYGVHFLNEDKLVGCREEELISIYDEWVPSKFEFRDKVLATAHFSVNGTVKVQSGTQGEVLKVMRGESGNIAYHVRFPGVTLQISERMLEFADRQSAAEIMAL